MAESLNLFEGSIFFCMTKLLWQKNYLPRLLGDEGCKHHLKWKHDSSDTYESELRGQCKMKGKRNETARKKLEWGQRERGVGVGRGVGVLPPAQGPRVHHAESCSRNPYGQNMFVAWPAVVVRLLTLGGKMDGVASKWLDSDECLPDG